MYSMILFSSSGTLSKNIFFTEYYCTGKIRVPIQSSLNVAKETSKLFFVVLVMYGQGTLSFIIQHINLSESFI